MSVRWREPVVTPAETLPPAGPTPAPEQGFALPSTAALAGGLAGMVLLAALLVRHTTTGRGHRNSGKLWQAKDYRLLVRLQLGMMSVSRPRPA